MGCPEILMMNVKLTSTLDFAAPLLWGIRKKYPDAKLSVLYCSTTAEKMLRGGNFYRRLFDKYGIRQYDFTDSCDLTEAEKREYRNKITYDFRDMIPEEERKNYPEEKKEQDESLKAEAELKKLLRPGKLLREINPDIVLFDNRYSFRCPERDEIYEYLAEKARKVVMLPHAPHQATDDDFTFFDRENDIDMTDNCDYWMGFIHDKIWKALPERKEQFYYSGYPGLDSEWQKHCLSENTRKREELNCLFIIRAFTGLKSGRENPDGNPFIFEEDEMLSIFSKVTENLKRLDLPIRLTVKPHPVNNRLMLRNLFDSFESDSFKIDICQDSIYSCLGNTDFVISLYSTTLLIPAIAGIPLALLNTRVQETIHEWKILEDMYKGLKYFVNDIDSLRDILPEICDLAQKQRNGLTALRDNCTHLRNFFPDGSKEKCFKRLEI